MQGEDLRQSSRKRPAICLFCVATAHHIQFLFLPPFLFIRSFFSASTDRISPVSAIPFLAIQFLHNSLSPAASSRDTETADSIFGYGYVL